MVMPTLALYTAATTKQHLAYRYYTRFAFTVQKKVSVASIATKFGKYCFTLGRNITILK